MSSFTISLSGLNADEEALNVVSNNLANLSTTGFKSDSASFQDLFYQALGTDGAGDPISVGVGSTIGAVTTNFTPGTINNTGVPTNAAIEGNGFFVVQNQGLTEYTRDGDFTLNANGQLVTDTGALVLGYQASNGVVNSNSSLAPITINSGELGTPTPTGNVSIDMNLDSAAGTGATFSTPVTVYDSQGVAHVLNFNFTETSANNWGYTITIPAADVGKTGSPVQVSTGTLTFDGNGNLTAPATDVTKITIPGTLADGATAPTFTWNLYGASGNSLVTQVGAPSAATQTEQDGVAAGTISQFNIAQDGTIEGTLSNGQQIALGQIALATFSNPQGLLQSGGNAYVTTAAAGSPNSGVPGTGGRGTIVGGALEASNVDIATEFASLLEAERDYQANARAVTTADEVTQAAIAIKQS